MPEATSKKPKPPTERQYIQAMHQQALIYCPSISPCADCGWPHVYGYCCHYCGSEFPEHGTPKEK